MSVDLYFTTDSIFFLSSFRQLLSVLAERNSIKTGHILESECDLKTDVRNLGTPSPYKLGAQKPPFSRI